jgi:hypothetical protein
MMPWLRDLELRTPPVMVFALQIEPCDIVARLDAPTCFRERADNEAMGCLASWPAKAKLADRRRPSRISIIARQPPISTVLLACKSASLPLQRFANSGEGLEYSQISSFESNSLHIIQSDYDLNESDAHTSKISTK